MSFRFFEIMAMLIRTRKSKFALGVKFLVLLTVVLFYASLPHDKFANKGGFEEKGESSGIPNELFDF